MGTRPDAKAKRLQAAHGISLEVVLVARTESQQSGFDDALRLLAVWAVRAARGQTEARNPDLTVRPPEAMNAPRIKAQEKT